MTVGVRVECPIYPKDPTVAREDPDFGVFGVTVPWEPGLADGPTNARFANSEKDRAVLPLLRKTLESKQK